ncbi:MAG: hypothetical protein WDO72_05855 [Pseudomonadota bacterium]
MKRNHMKLAAAGGKALALLLGMTPIVDATTPKEEYSAMQHEFDLETGEKLLLSHRHKIASYRICVDAFQGSVPLKIFVDGKESLIPVAACETITGKHINVEAGAKLPSGEYLVARFRQLREKS